MSTTSVAIISYNTREHVRACLETLRCQQPHETIVVDNASTDGTIDMLRALYPETLLVTNPSNRGYGAAANQAMTRSSADYLLLLNSDTRLRPGALDALGAYLDQHPRAAIVGPRLLNPDGTLQVSCFPYPTPLYVLQRDSSLGILFSRLPGLKRWYLPASAHDQARVVPWVLGAALLIRRTAFDAVGGFDERFFMYFEEADLCYRLAQAGWHVHFAPGADVVHIGGASTSRHRAAMVVQLYRSQLQFYRHHYSLASRLMLSLVMSYLMTRNLLRDALELLRIRDVAQRVALGENIGAWSTVLLGGV